MSSPLLSVASAHSSRYNTAEFIPSSFSTSASSSPSTGGGGAAGAMKQHRLGFVDAYRGLLTAGVVICEVCVNSSGYSVFLPSAWDGLTFHDMLLPAFLFDLGLDLALSTDTKMSKDLPKMPLLIHSVVRMIKLFLLGFFLVNFPSGDLATWRVFGPLQRIGICYFLVSLIAVALPHNRDGRIPRVFFQYLNQWAIILSFILVYICLTTAARIACPSLSVDNPSLPESETIYRRGDLGPYCNVAYSIDESVLTRHHMYASAACKWPFSESDTDAQQRRRRQDSLLPDVNDYCLDFEPEGILGRLCYIFRFFLS